MSQEDTGHSAEITIQCIFYYNSSPKVDDFLHNFQILIRFKKSNFAMADGSGVKREHTPLTSKTGSEEVFLH